MSARRWLLLGGALVVVLLAAAFFLAFERVEVELDTGPSPAARRDPMLAAQRLLAELGVPSEGVGTLEPLPPPDHVVVALAGESALEEVTAERLAGWVASGGRLLIGHDEALVAAIGFEAGPIEIEAESELAVVEVWSRPGLRHPVELSRRRFFVLQAEPPPFLGGPWAEDGTLIEDSTALVRVTHGAGWVTFLSDADLFTNDRLGQHQHAALLASLATVGGVPKGARFVRWLAYPSLGTLVLRHGWPICAGAALVLGAWVWRVSRRRGPLVADPEPSRRSLLEHIRATASFHARHLDLAELVGASRRALLQRAAERVADVGGLPELERARRIASVAGVDAPSLERALLGAMPATPDDAARTIQTLERARRSL
jgi:hypothetical protein